MIPSPRAPAQRRPPPTVPDLVVAPELATLALLDAALEVAVAALLAEHMTLIDDLRPSGRDGPVVELADVVCRRAGSLRNVLARYTRAVRDAANDVPVDPDTDLPF
jgi:hypothetical protein